MTELTDYAKYREVKLSAVHSDGWLKRYLQIQKDGLTGHMEVSGFPFNTVGWGGDKVDHIYGGAWWPYEQTGYWVDGAIRCAHLLRDKDLIEKAGKQIEFVLDHADADGYLGPDFLKPELGDGRWPHAVFFRAMAAHYLATGDQRIPQAIAKHYLTESDPHSKARNVVNVESMLWAYRETGEKRLLDLAVKAYEEYNKIHPEQDTTVENMLSDRISTEHGVTFNEQAKLGAIMYLSLIHI